MKELDTATGHNIESSPEGMRNQQIIEAIEKGFTPLLPFEIDLLSEQIHHYKKAQVGLGRQLGEAMEQTSETWHDNAPADAINAQSILLSRQAETTIGILDSAKGFDYPSLGEKRVTLGSLVEILYEGDDEPEIIYITGTTNNIQLVNDYTDADFPEEIDTATLSSPLGRSLLSAVEGDVRSYTVNGRIHTVMIRAVLQECFSR